MRVSARFKQRAGAVLRILGLVFLPPVFVGLAEFFGDLAQAPDAPKGWLYAKWAMLCCVVLVPPATFFLGRWILQRGRLERAFDVGLRTLRHILSPKGTGDPRLPTYRMTVFIRTKEKDAIALAPTFRMTSEPDGALLHHGDAGFENTEAFQPGQPFVGLAYSEGRDIYEQLRALEDFNVDPGLSGNDAHEARGRSGSNNGGRTAPRSTRNGVNTCGTYEPFGCSACRAKAPSFLRSSASTPS